MFRNQYIVVSTDHAMPACLGMRNVDFNGLRIHSHPTLNVSVAKRSSVEIALFGFILDPFHPDNTDNDVVAALADTCTTAEEFFAQIERLSGRFVLLYKNQSSFVAVGDACHLRQVYFAFLGGAFVLTSSPRLFLTYFQLDLQIAKEKQALTLLPAYATHENAWYGDRSIDDRLYKLLPNHYLDLTDGAARRIPLRPGNETESDEQIMDGVSTILQGTYSALVRRYRLLQAVTAGWDSRILLAASREVKDRVQYYVFAWSSKATADVRVPRELSKTLGLKFMIIEPLPLREEFLSQYCMEHIEPRILPKTAQIQYHYDQGYDPDVINVNGNGAEIARCFYGYTGRKVTVDMLLTFSGYGRAAGFVREELERWYPRACQYASELGIPLLDLFYWEQRMGHWGAQFPFEQDIAVEEISPFSNRLLLHSLLRVPAEKRRAPNYSFFRKLIRRLWRETLTERVNPDAHYVTQAIKGSSLMSYCLLASLQKMKVLRSGLLRQGMRRRSPSDLRTSQPGRTRGALTGEAQHGRSEGALTREAQHGHSGHRRAIR